MCCKLIQDRIQWWGFEDGSEIFVLKVEELFELQNSFVIVKRDSELCSQSTTFKGNGY